MKEFWSEEQRAAMRGVPCSPSIKPTKSLLEGEKTEEMAAYLMPLAGIYNPHVGDGRTYCLSLGELTGRMWRDATPYGGIVEKLCAAPLPPNAFNSYGPHPIAAAVLVSANNILRPLVESAQFGMSHPALSHISPKLRLAVTAALGFQVVRMQPGFCALSMQAWQVQRAMIENSFAQADYSVRYAPKNNVLLQPLMEITGLPETRGALFGVAFAAAVEEAAREPDAIIWSRDPEHHIPKLVTHPIELVDRFLSRVDVRLSPDDVISKPIMAIDIDEDTYAPAWLANAISRNIQIEQPPEIFDEELATLYALADQQLFN